MRNNKKALEEKQYTLHRCYLIKKRRGLFRRKWIIECEDRKYKVRVGKTLYCSENVGAKLVVERDGKKLINIKQGFTGV